MALTPAVPQHRLRVLVTRPAAQADEWVQHLHAAGIEAQALPLIGIAAAPDGGEALRHAWATLSQQRLVMFVSPNAVAHFFAQQPEGMAWPAEVRAASPGPGTTRALLAHGVPLQCIAEPAADAPQFDSEALWQQLQGQDWAGSSVLMVRGTGGRDWLAQQLAARGAHVHFVAAYQRAAPQLSALQHALLQQALAQPAHYLWFFSSSEAIANLDALAPQADWSHAIALATHPRIAERAARLGVGRVLATRPSIAAVVACIQSISS